MRRNLLREVERCATLEYPKVLPHVKFETVDWLKLPITKTFMYIQTGISTGEYTETVEELEAIFMGIGEQLGKI